jgi:hypothetical protein
MKALKERFIKNGLVYTLVKRTRVIGLFKLSLGSNEIVGYEVSRIYINPPRFFKGKLVGEVEYITKNSRFNLDDCKAFFPNQLNEALEYYDSLTIPEPPMISDIERVKWYSGIDSPTECLKT